jgi:hypothetical protein
MASAGRLSDPYNETDDAGEVPLLSDDGRSFLDGKIDAEVYIENSTRDAAEHAKRDLSIYLRQRRRHRSGLLVVLAIAAVAYGVLGIVSLATKGQGGFSAIALSTSFAAILVTFLTSLHNGDEEEAKTPHNLPELFSLHGRRRGSDKG